MQQHHIEQRGVPREGEVAGVGQISRSGARDRGSDMFGVRALDRLVVVVVRHQHLALGLTSVGRQPSWARSPTFCRRKVSRARRMGWPRFYIRTSSKPLIPEWAEPLRAEYQCHG
jgi:hypothetical protein